MTAAREGGPDASGAAERLGSPAAAGGPAGEPAAVGQVTVARGGALAIVGEASQRVAQTLCFFVLAGVLSPREFGLAAVAFLTVQVVNSVTYAGLGPALNALGHDAARDRTAVGLALLAGTAGAALMVLLSGPIATLFGAPEAARLVQLVALTLPLLQLSEVGAALLERDYRFGATATAMITASVASAAAGVGLALAGAGAAALVAQTLVHAAVRAVVLVGVRPDLLRPGLDRTSARELWVTGRPLLVNTTLVAAYANADNAAVGTLLGPGPLGAYGFAYNLANIPFFLVGVALNRVFLPTYARLLRAGRSLGAAYRASLTATSCLSALPLLYLLLAGEHALVAVFGHKWDDAVVPLQVLSAYALLRTVGVASQPLFVAQHRTVVVRRTQQWQLLGLLVLVVPLTRWAGTAGTAAAVALPTAVGTLWLVHLSAQATGVRLRAAWGGVGLGVAAGALGGAAALAVFSAVDGVLGLLLSLLAAVAAWALPAAVLLRRLRLAGR